MTFARRGRDDGSSFATAVITAAGITTTEHAVDGFQPRFDAGFLVREGGFEGEVFVEVSFHAASVGSGAGPDKPLPSRQ